MQVRRRWRLAVWLLMLQVFVLWMLSVKTSRGYRILSRWNDFLAKSAQRLLRHYRGISSPLFWLAANVICETEGWTLQNDFASVIFWAVLQRFHCQERYYCQVISALSVVLLDGGLLLA